MSCTTILPVTPIRPLAGVAQASAGSSSPALAAPLIVDNERAAVRCTKCGGAVRAVYETRGTDGVWVIHVDERGWCPDCLWDERP